MAAVIAAIGAAFLAGAIALFREHRLQQRQLLVAARVIDATFDMAQAGINTSLSRDDWYPFNEIPGRDSFFAAWEAHKADLAGHLTWSEWLDVARAVNFYFVLAAFDQRNSPMAEQEVMNRTTAELGNGTKILRPYCTTRLSAWKLFQRRIKKGGKG
jgi:hypothetical protein